MERIPSLTAKALVDFSRKSPAAKRSLLRKQKFPGDGASKFQIPYYGLAVAAIRAFFSEGKHDVKAIRAAKNKAQSKKLLSRRENLLRVLDAFSGSSLRERRLSTAKNSHHAAALHGMNLKANPEMTAIEEGRTIHLFFHFGATPLEPERAQLLADVVYWVLRKEDSRITTSSVEVWDMQANKVVRPRGAIPETARFIELSMKEASTLWPELAPTS